MSLVKHTGRQTQQQHSAGISVVLVIDQWEDERRSRNERVCLTGRDSDINLPFFMSSALQWATQHLKASSLNFYTRKTEKDSVAFSWRDSVCSKLRRNYVKAKVKAEFSLFFCKEMGQK